MKVISHFYGNKQNIIITNKPIKEIKTEIIKRLQNKKDSYVTYNGYRFELEDQYIYPNKESEYIYFESPEFKTDKKIVVIKNKKELNKIEKKEFIDNWVLEK